MNFNTRTHSQLTTGTRFIKRSRLILLQKPVLRLANYPY